MKFNKFQLSEELAELIGAFIGDGFIGRYGKNPGYHVEFVGSPKHDKKYYNYLSKIIIKNFNVKPRFKIHQGALRMLITYKEFYNFFEGMGFPCGLKNKTVKIPSNLYDSELVKYVIRGIFDTDGFLFLDKRTIYNEPYARIGFSTKSKKLFQQVKKLFLKRNYKIYSRVDKRADIYHIEIYGNKQIRRWISEFGFSNTDKKNYAPVAQSVER